MPKQTERNQRILALWNEGVMGGAIAQELGISRNAVLGVVNRARSSGMDVRSLAPEVKEARGRKCERKAVTVAPVTLAKKADRVPARDHFPDVRKMVVKAQERIIPQPEKINACTGKSAALETAPTVKVSATSQPVALLDLRPYHCRFPLWGNERTVTEKLFCGAPRAENDRCYCAEHRALARVPLAQWKQEKQQRVRRKA